MAITFDTFLEKSIAIHGNKYDYSLSKIDFISGQSKIKIICPIHGIFEQKAVYHYYNGCNCPKCYKNYKPALQEFIDYVNNIHNFKYDYSKVIYNTNKDKIIIVCPKHGEFLQTPNHHQQGDGCRECGFEISRDARRLTLDVFIERATEIHNNKYNYSKFIYKNSSTKGIIICTKHGEFDQAPDPHILKKQGCPKCVSSISKPEIEWLDFLNINENYRHPKGFKINGKKIKPDAYDPITNTIYEFYGDFYHGNPNKYDQKTINPITKTSYGELYEKTINKEQLIKYAGYNLITIWDSEWKIIKSSL